MACDWWRNKWGGIGASGNEMIAMNVWDDQHIEAANTWMRYSRISLYCVHTDEAKGKFTWPLRVGAMMPMRVRGRRMGCATLTHLHLQSQ